MENRVVGQLTGVCGCVCVCLCLCVCVFGGGVMSGCVGGWRMGRHECVVICGLLVLVVLAWGEGPACGSTC